MIIQRRTSKRLVIRSCRSLTYIRCFLFPRFHCLGILLRKPSPRSLGVAQPKLYSVCNLYGIRIYVIHHKRILDCIVHAKCTTLYPFTDCCSYVASSRCRRLLELFGSMACTEGAWNYNNGYWLRNVSCGGYFVAIHQEGYIILVVSVSRSCYYSHWCGFSVHRRKCKVTFLVVFPQLSSCPPHLTRLQALLQTLT